MISGGAYDWKRNRTKKKEAVEVIRCCLSCAATSGDNGDDDDDDDDENENVGVYLYVIYRRSLTVLPNHIVMKMTILLPYFFGTEKSSSFNSFHSQCSLFIFIVVIISVFP